MDTITLDLLFIITTLVAFPAVLWACYTVYILEGTNIQSLKTVRRTVRCVFLVIVHSFIFTIGFSMLLLLLL